MKKFSIDIDDDDIFEEAGNAYINDEKKGLSLVSEVISGGKNFYASNIDDIVDMIISSCGHVHVKDEMKIKILTERLKTPMRYKVLNGTTVIGIGGTFSSGKSSFLNSLLENNSVLLPVDQNASTSVATYIMNEKNENITACNTFGREVKLNSEALQAVSHGFLRKYGLNLAQYLDFIAVQTPSLTVKNVALLDTPGYDNGIDIRNLGDRARSQTALKSVDRLIWLVPAMKGTAEDVDIDFIKKLGKGIEVLLVVSKCDLQSEVWRSQNPEQHPIIKKIKSAFTEKEISICDVIPYTTFDTNWNDCKKRVIKFLENSSKSAQNVSDIQSEINEIINGLRNDIDKSLASLTRQADELAMEIDSTLNPLDIPSIMRFYGILGSQISNIRYDKNNFEDNVSILLKWLNERIGRY